MTDGAAAIWVANDDGVDRLPKTLPRARLVEAFARAGNPAAARQAARDYQREFPDGRYRTQVESQLP